MKVIGIESSHDDTSIALVDNHFVVFNYKISQTEIHKQFGGTVPEIASREHYNNFFVLLEKILQNHDLLDVDFIAYTEKPGLIGALQMGKLFAHSLSIALNKPLIPTNHLEGHIFSVLLSNNKKEKKEIVYPSIALVISGGHTNLYYLENKNSLKLIGQTLDDACGEVFDKVARTLNLGFPGGPIIDDIFYKNKDKDFSKFKLNTPKLDNEFDFSFSGFKTQIINYVKKCGLDEKELIASSFEKTAIDFVILKIKNAINTFSPKTLILSGGVSANKYLRNEFLKLHPNTKIPLIEYTTDNGAMIASCAIEKNKKNF